MNSRGVCKGLRALSNTFKNDVFPYWSQHVVMQNVFVCMLLNTKTKFWIQVEIHILFGCAHLLWQDQLPYYGNKGLPCVLLFLKKWNRIHRLHMNRLYSQFNSINFSLNYIYFVTPLMVDTFNTAIWNKPFA